MVQENLVLLSLTQCTAAEGLRDPWLLVCNSGFAWPQKVLLNSK